jgi:hypothetical protein
MPLMPIVHGQLARIVEFSGIQGNTLNLNMNDGQVNSLNL